MRLNIFFFLFLLRIFSLHIHPLSTVSFSLRSRTPFTFISHSFNISKSGLHSLHDPLPMASYTAALSKLHPFILSSFSYCFRTSFTFYPALDSLHFAASSLSASLACLYHTPFLSPLEANAFSIRLSNHSIAFCI